MNIILILLLILLIFYILLVSYDIIVREAFKVYWSGDPISYSFNNTRMGQTSNMSYDLRGDPLIIRKYPFMWNYSTLTPIYNKHL